MTEEQLIETKISTETVFQGSYLEIFRDRVKNFFGTESTREYIHHPGAALIIPKLKNGKYLILRQYRHACGEVFWEFPAGRRDKNEPLQQTAHRELTEETGYRAGKMTPLTTIRPAIGYADEVIEIFLGEDLSFHGSSPDSDEILISKELSFSELINLVMSGKITDVKTQIAIFWLEKFLKGDIK